MELEKALKLFGITDLASETESSIKKKYRKLMTKYHPDNQGGSTELAASVSSAYSLLKETLEKISSYIAAEVKTENYNIIIPLSQLIRLYSGERITLGNSEEQKEFGIKDIQKYGALIIIDTTLTHNGLSYNFSNVQRWSISDKYVINCDIYVDNIMDDEKIRIRLEDIEKEFSFSSQSISINLSLPYNISVVIMVTKKIRVTEEK